jgi:hypothetical protein
MRAASNSISLVIRRWVSSSRRALLRVGRSVIRSSDSLRCGELVPQGPDSALQGALSIGRAGGTNLRCGAHGVTAQGCRVLGLAHVAQAPAEIGG